MEIEDGIPVGGGDAGKHLQEAISRGAGIQAQKEQSQEKYALRITRLALIITNHLKITKEITNMIEETRRLIEMAQKNPEETRLVGSGTLLEASWSLPSSNWSDANSSTSKSRDQQLLTKALNSLSTSEINELEIIYGLAKKTT